MKIHKLHLSISNHYIHCQLVSVRNGGHEQQVGQGGIQGVEEVMVLQGAKGREGLGPLSLA